MIGAKLILLHPEVAGRSCETCKKYLHDDSGGRFGQVVRRPAKTGPPVPRPAGSKTPCAVCPKIPAAMPADSLYAVELTPELVATYSHYLECKAVGQFPDDPIVRRNAAIISAVEGAVSREQSRRMGLSVLGSLLGG